MNIKEQLRKYRRVLSIARKPGKEEFLVSTKISGLGIILIGFIGFLIFLLFALALPFI